VEWHSRSLFSVNSLCANLRHTVLCRMAGVNQLNERELYMLNALRVIASYGRQGKVTLRPYMSEHNLPWDNDEDVKVWMRRIAEDAIKHVASRGAALGSEQG
jgi:pyruvate-formate lyase-activating enzyme